MPRSSSVVINCDLPIRYDTYLGCSFRCDFCNEQRKGRGVGAVRLGEGLRALKAFIGGHRYRSTKWCDWDIPLHWGVLSDPFQPRELEAGRSYRSLQEFAYTGYPVVISTKSIMLADRKYYSILRHCNVVLQVSMTSPGYDTRSKCPTYRERFGALYKLSKAVRRLIVRIQPYELRDLDFVLKILPAYAASGVYGITIEGMRSTVRVGRITQRYGNVWVYPLLDLIRHFKQIRNAAHLAGLRFYSAENRLRDMGDSPTCCGVDNLVGFRVNRANLNYGEILYTPRMEEQGTAGVFSLHTANWRDLSYKDVMEDVERRVLLGKY